MTAAVDNNDQLWPVLLLVIGALLGFLPTFVLERRREKREDKRRWHERAVDAITDFELAANAFQERSWQHNVRKNGPRPTTDDLDKARITLVFIAPREVTFAADRYAQALIMFDAGTNLVADQSEKLYEVVSTRALIFVNEVRTYLGQDPIEKLFGFDPPSSSPDWAT